MADKIRFMSDKAPSADDPQATIMGVTERLSRRILSPTTERLIGSVTGTAVSIDELDGKPPTGSVSHTHITINPGIAPQELQDVADQLADEFDAEVRDNRDGFPEGGDSTERHLSGNVLAG